MQFKPQHHKPYRFLKQLPIPERPWNSISIDFIEKLPSFSGFDTILIIVAGLEGSNISFRVNSDVWMIFLISEE